MARFKVHQLVRVRETKMLGTVLQVGRAFPRLFGGKTTVRVVIGNRPKLDLERWAEELKKNPHASVPGYLYLEGELEAYGKKESGDAAV